MSTKAATTSSTRTGRSAVPGDRRRGRSRSPSAYLKKSGKSIKGFLSTGGSKKDARKSLSKKQRSAPVISGSITKTSASKPSSPTSVANAPRASSFTVPTSPKKNESKVTSDAPRAKEETTATEKQQPKEEDSTPKEVASSVDDSTTVSGLSVSPSHDDDEAVYNVVVEEPPVAESESEDVNEEEESTEEQTKKEDEAAAKSEKSQQPTKKQEEAAASKTAANPQDDKSTTTADQAEKKTMQLLLIEPQSRRFELLQLEFNPDRAVVQDILSQVAVTATEHSLREQEYVGICSIRGREMDHGIQLVDFVELGHEVALAVPLGLTGADVAKLASPILTDPKIKSVFNSVLDKLDFDVPDVPFRLEIGNMAKEDKGTTSRSAPGGESAAAPLNEDATKAEDRKIANVIAGDAEDEYKSSGGGMPSLAVIVALIAAVVPLVIVIHRNIASPIGPGDSLGVGQWRSKCGLLSLIPEDYTGCHDMSLELDSDGMLTLFDTGSLWNDERTVAWKMTSSVAPGEDAKLQVLEDGTVTIGGKPPKMQKSSFAGTKLTPWPFVTEPNGKAPKADKTKEKKENPLRKLLKRN